MKNEERKAAKSRILSICMLSIALVFLIFAAVFAWFAANKSVSAGGMRVSSKLSDDVVSVRVVDENGDEELDFSNLIPGSDYSFYISISNETEETQTISIKLSDFEHSSTNLFDVLTLSVDGTEFTSFPDEGLIICDSIEIPATSSEEDMRIECTFSMSGDAGNDYQGASASVGMIEIY